MSEWYGVLPNGWQDRYLSQTCDEQCNKNIGNQEDNVLSLSYGQIIRKKNKYGGLTPTDFATYQIVEPGNIILRLTDLQNDHTSLRTGLVRERGIITSAYCCLKPWESAEYLQYLLHAYDTQKYFYGLGGGVRQSIGFKDIRYVHLPIPPREEQDQIVRYLDWKISQVNRLINAKKKQIGLLQELAGATVSMLLNQCGAKVRLSICTSKIGSGKTPRGGSSIYVDSGVFFIRSQNVYPNGIVKTRGYYITDAIDESMKNTRVLYGDVLLNITGGSIGRCCVYALDERANVNQHVCIIRPNQKILLPEFLAYYLNSSDGQRMIFGNQNEGNRQSLTFVQIADFEIPLPSIDIQKQLLVQIRKKIEPTRKLTDKIQTEISILHEYRTRLISDVVTGKLDVREVAVPDFEAVEEAAAEDEAQDEEQETDGTESMEVI